MAAQLEDNRLYWYKKHLDMMTKQERKQLGLFLKTKRESLSPTNYDFPVGRRRTPGLRREEVAQLAGISPTWYTWIEQGRDIGFSAEILNSLARVFELSPHETRYLFSLVGQKVSPAHSLEEQAIPTTIQHILNHQGIYPAYVIGRYWDVLGWNRAARNLFIGLDQIETYPKNLIWYMFVSPHAKTIAVDWEVRARRNLAEFRTDCGQMLSDPWLQSLLDALQEESPEFKEWWSQHDVLSREGGRRDFYHPQIGRLVLNQTTLFLSDQPEKKIILHIPEDESEMLDKLERLSQL